MCWSGLCNGEVIGPFWIEGSMKLLEDGVWPLLRHPKKIPLCFNCTAVGDKEGKGNYGYLEMNSGKQRRV